MHRQGQSIDVQVLMRWSGLAFLVSQLTLASLRGARPMDQGGLPPVSEECISWAAIKPVSPVLQLARSIVRRVVFSPVRWITKTVVHPGFMCGYHSASWPPHATMAFFASCAALF